MPKPWPGGDLFILIGDGLGDIGFWPLAVVALVLLILLLAGFSWVRRDLPFRILFWLPARLFYRLRVAGRENIPAQGPVLLVCNHVSFIDAFLVLIAQNRPVRFFVWAPFMKMPGLRMLLRLAQAIPIDSTGGPRAIVGALRYASEALARGEVVGIFAEGGISRTGFLLPFHRGIEQILKRSPAPVIPVYLDHVWGSIFSFQGRRFFWKIPQRIPYPVWVNFGNPLPATVTAAEVRQAIQVLSADSAILRKNKHIPVHRKFLRRAARHPFCPCFVDVLNKGKVWRYGQVVAATRIMSRMLRPILEQDEMVGLWMPPSLGGAFANIALAFLGKVSVNLNYTSSPQVVASAARQCKLRHILTSRLFTAKVPINVPGVELIYLEDFRKEVTTWQRLRAYLAVLLLPGFVLDRWVYRLGNHRPSDLATVIFSSGSTGDPKGVMLTHRNLSANSESVVQAIDPRADDRMVGVLPFFHSFGYTVTLWVPLQVGTSVIYYADPRQAKEIGDLCRNQRCTILLTTPTFLRFYLKRCEPNDFATVRILMCGAEKLPPALALEFKEKFGVLPLEGYGCTELSPVAAANVPDWTEGSARQIGNKAGTIGQPVPGVAAKIIDPETLAPIVLGREGLLLVYGANVMKGYLGRLEATREAMIDGWYITGDIAKIDEDGFITITDRLARFSKVGGEMVPHQKIEDEIHLILGTSERICVVTAVPDQRRGERLVVLHTALNGIDRHRLCGELGMKGLPNLWVPAERDFYQIAELPILGTGKVDLKRVKEIALDKVNS